MNRSIRLAPEAEAKLQENRELWDAWTRARESAAFDDLAAFRAGESSLSAAERMLIGDVRGLRVLHLQCHFGLNSLSLARQGAIVTGVDFSTASIELARQLASEVGIQARFEVSDIYRLPAVLDDRFDLVYSSRGVLCWLPDINGWAHVVADALVPGGRLHLFDSHPIAQIFDEDRDLSDPQVRYPYFGDPEGDPVPIHAFDGSEADENGTDVAYQWTHPLGDIVSALADAGFRIVTLREHQFSFWQAFPGLLRDPDDPRIWRPDDAVSASIPFTFSVDAIRS